MTLKQFFQLAGGLLFSLLFYASGLHPVIKWPLILFFALLGVALAFLPFEDRPLDRWIVAFFRSVYSPTIFAWKQIGKQTNFYQNEAVAPKDDFVAPRGEAELNKYLQGRAYQQQSFFKKLEETEKAFLNRISSLFGQPKIATAQPFQQPMQPPQPVARVQVRTQQPVQQAGVKIPEIEMIRVAQQQQTQRPKLVVQEKSITQQQGPVAQTIKAEKSDYEAQQAKFSVDAAPPMPPQRENTVSGQVMDPDGKIVESAILEFRDVSGRPVRAVKTNKLGHFLIVTSLSNGTYEIETEKDGLIFDNVKFDATGSIIPPIAIRARERISTNA